MLNTGEKVDIKNILNLNSWAYISENSQVEIANYLKGCW